MSVYVVFCVVLSVVLFVVLVIVVRVSVDDLVEVEMFDIGIVVVLVFEEVEIE